jgi:hypothetical protein
MWDRIWVLWQFVFPSRVNWASSQTKYVPPADAVPRSNDRNLLQLQKHRVRELEHAGSGLGTGFRDVNFNTPAFEMCATDGKFDAHSASGSAGPLAVSVLGHGRAAWYLWMIPCLAAAGLCWSLSLCFCTDGLETDSCTLQPLSTHSIREYMHKMTTCVLFVSELLIHRRSRYLHVFLWAATHRTNCLFPRRLITNYLPDGVRAHMAQASSLSAPEGGLSTSGQTSSYKRLIPVDVTLNWKRFIVNSEMVH